MSVVKMTAGRPIYIYERNAMDDELEMSVMSIEEPE